MLFYIRWLVVFTMLGWAPGRYLQADITNWETGDTIPGTEGIVPGPGVNLSNWNMTERNLMFANLADIDLHGANFADSWLDQAWFQRSNLMNARFDNGLLGFGRLVGADFSEANLSGAWFTRAALADADLSDAVAIGAGFAKAALIGADLSGADLSGADFQWSFVTGANFSGAVVAGASFGPDITDFTREQLYSTASYVEKSLKSIAIYHSDFSGADFSGHDLAGATFAAVNLADADFTGADLIRADIFLDVLERTNFSRADLRAVTRFEPGETTLTSNMIWPNQEIRGLGLVFGETLVVRGTDLASPGDRDIVAITDGLIIEDGATLELVRQEFEGEQGSFVSTPHLSVEADSPIDLGGTLRLSGVLPEIGETLDLFEWPDPLAQNNVFAAIELPPDTVWDLSQLYTTGDIVFAGSSTCDPNSQGDIDGNGKVEFMDFLILADNYGTDVAGHQQGDLDCNGKVEFVDFLVLSANFGNDVSVASIPEPSAMSLWGMGVLSLLGFSRRRRARY